MCPIVRGVAFTHVLLTQSVLSWNFSFPNFLPEKRHRVPPQHPVSMATGVQCLHEHAAGDSGEALLDLTHCSWCPLFPVLYFSSTCFLLFTFSISCPLCPISSPYAKGLPCPVPPAPIAVSLLLGSAPCVPRPWWGLALSISDSCESRF